MISSFNITSGVSDHVPRRLFLSKDLILKERLRYFSDNYDEENYYDDAGLLIYKPILEIQDCLGEHLQFNSRIVNNGRLATFFINTDQQVSLNSFCIQNNKLKLERTWTMKSPYNKSPNPHYMTTFSPDLSYCVMLKHFNQAIPFSSTKSKIRISIARLKVVTFKNVGSSQLYKNVHTLKYTEQLGYFVACLSPNNNYLAITSHFHPEGNSFTEILKIKYNETSDSYSFDQLQRIQLKYHVHYIKFNCFESKLILAGSRKFHIIHPIENTGPIHSTTFNGCNPFLIYVHKLKGEYLFTQRKESIEINKIDLKKHEKIRSLRYEELKESGGSIKSFYVHSHLENTRMFLGFSQEIYIFNPFNFQCLCRMSLGSLENPFNCYTLDVNWSGQEVAISYWNKSDFVALKIYHLDNESDISLQHQASLVVMATYSLQTLRNMKLPKHFRRLVGDYR